jgi:hypothetical protein
MFPPKGWHSSRRLQDMAYNRHLISTFYYCTTQVEELRLILSMGPKRVSLSSHLKKETDQFFRNVVFSSYLEFRPMDNVQKPSDSWRNIILPGYAYFIIIN